MKKIWMVLGLLGFFILVQGCDKTSTTLDVTNLPVDSVTVHFDANGGSDVDSQVFATSDTNINLPVSEREGYTFIGWYYNLNDRSAVNDFKDVTDLSITLHAKWEINLYSIAFFDEESLLSLNVPFLGDISFLDDVISNKKGHTFIGWYLDEDFTELFILDEMPAMNINLYGLWEKNSYNLTFLDFDDSVIYEESILYGSSLQDIEVEAPMRLGFSFNGWSIDLPEIMPDEPLILKAYYVVNNYTISFETFEGSIIEDVTLPYNFSFFVESPTLEGYSFKGWYSDEELSVPYIDFIVPAMDITLYAKYEVNTYTINFDTQSGTAMEEMEFEYMSSIDIPEPQREGYDFDGWYFDYSFEDAFDWVYMQATDIFLIAKWKVEEIEIIYHLDGGLNHENNPLSVDPSQDLQLYNPTKLGYTFAGWYLEPDYSGEAVTFIDMSLNSEVNLYAKWTVSQYAVTYVLLEEPIDEEMAVLYPNEIIIDTVSGDSHTLLLTSFNRVFSYGDNGYGQLGANDSNRRNYPVEITDNFSLNGDEKIERIFAGSFFSAAISSEGRIFTWGANDFGQLALSPFDNHNYLIPKDITNIFDFFPNEEISDVSLGMSHSILVTSNGRVFTWGRNYYGNLGIGTYDELFHSDPIEITFAFGFDQTTLEYPKHIEASMDGTILVTSNNRNFVFGSNQWNSLALGETPYVTTPYEITDLFAFNVDEEVEIVKSRALSAVLVTSENRVFTWGCNFSGELGLGYSSAYENVTDITGNISLQLGETIIDVSAGNSLIIITSLGRFLFAGERQIVPGFRPSDNIYPITDLTYVFTLNEGEHIAKLVDKNSYSKSVLTSSGRVLAWGQLYNLGMGTTNDWEMIAPNEINLVYLTSLHIEMYEYGEVITPYVYSKDGYDFVGWYSDDDLSVEFDFLVEVTSDLIIYAYYVLSE